MAEASKKKYWIFLLVPAACVLLLVYFRYDPAIYPFPSCPSRKFLNIKCPGCGSQRAVHQLLHGNFYEAFSYNPILAFAIPYILLNLVFRFSPLQVKYPQLRKALFGRITIYCILVLVILYWIGRNLFNF